MLVFAALFCAVAFWGGKMHPMFEKAMVKNAMVGFGLVCALAFFMELVK